MSNATQVDYAEMGFCDGFQGRAAQGVSLGHDQQAAYLDAFRKGREHRERVIQVCEAEGVTINEVMRRAFDCYYESRYQS